MKPAPFEYVAPESLEAALAALAEYGDEAKVLAGGQSLIPAMNFRMAQPAVLVDLNKIGELDYIRSGDGGELLIGAMARQREVEHDTLVSQRAPLLHETMPFIAHPQIRNRGTFGGSLSHADPAAELPVVALALDARVRAARVGSERWIPIEDFFLGFFTTALEADEMIVEVAIPPLPPRTGTSFMEVARRTGDYAMMGVAALVTLGDDGACQRARLVYLNAGGGPVDATEAARMLVGHARDAEIIAAAADAAATHEIDPLGNVHATPEYQRHLARVLTRRALDTAFQRALASDGQ